MLWGVAQWELTLMHWADYERATGKPVRWCADIRDRVEEIINGNA